ncbi:hypothetical protein [Paraburkholderia sp. DHOC27]|uniref:hypothetical protein n=1 Tax=Paraburkholderia sp. DHOC27 TaxID=2303330 RepID=UPI000E3C869F|nr:hypothetical protein [Paraburkholderia sp. DHOC27]RFU44523.1 hypothetical protein D0B32_28415 [Paraburkholderia sp. DHOC27]
MKRTRHVAIAQIPRDETFIVNEVVMQRVVDTLVTGPTDRLAHYSMRRGKPGDEAIVRLQVE